MQSEELLKKIEGAVKDWTKDADQCFNNADPVISSIAERTTKVYGNNVRQWREDGIEKVTPLTPMYFSVWFYKDLRVILGTWLNIIINQWVKLLIIYEA